MDTIEPPADARPARPRPRTAPVTVTAGRSAITLFLLPGACVRGRVLQPDVGRAQRRLAAAEFAQVGTLAPPAVVLLGSESAAPASRGRPPKNRAGRPEVPARTARNRRCHRHIVRSADFDGGAVTAPPCRHCKGTGRPP